MDVWIRCGRPWLLGFAVAIAACTSDGDDDAADTDGGTSAGSEGAHGEAAPTLAINEVGCDGDDFVEIVNTGTAPVSLAEIAVGDGTHRAGFAADELGPGAFAVANLDGFGLRCGDESAVLVHGDAVIDEVGPPPPDPAGSTWGRLPDGVGPWVATTPSPGAANAPAVATPSLFDNGTIHDIEVELDDAAFAAIEGQAITPSICVPHDRDYFAGTVTIDGERFEGVGVRARGNGTADSLLGKPSLKLDFAWDDPAVEGCAEDRTAFGQRKLNLINMRQDPSFVRIPMAGELYAALGVPQPRTSWARLTINGAYTGIVVLGENIDRRFLAQWFPSNDGMMYESGCHCDVWSSNVPAAEGDPSCFTRDFSTDACDEPDPDDDPTDWSRLAQFTAALEALPPGEFYPGVEAFFDFDGFLSLWAATMFLGSGDGYFMNQNSYRIYHDPSTQRFAMIDHGSADGIMRTFSDTCGGEGVLGLGAPPDIFASTSVLASRCLAEADCAAAYAARMWEVYDAFAGYDLRARAVALHGFILPEMQADPRYYYNGCGSPYTWSQIEAHFDDYVLPWIDRRFAEVEGQLTAAGHPR